MDKDGLRISSKEYNNINDGIRIDIIINVGNAAQIASKIPECLNWFKLKIS